MVEMTVYVCPTEGCGNYHAASSNPDLARQVVGKLGQNGERHPPSRWHTRAQCPDCRARGVTVERRKVVVRVDPSELPESPLPQELLDARAAA